MTTDYDPIVEQYQQSKLQPWRTHIESYSLMSLLGDLSGLSVLDLACGAGYYSRLCQTAGARRVVGVDLSAGMVDLARRLENHQPQGIEYHVGDACTFDCGEQFDVVVAAYLLNYARTPQELQAMCGGIHRHLKPGGRFVTVNSSPFLHFPSAPSYRPYEFETFATQEWIAGAPVQWRFHVNGEMFDIENYYLDADLHNAAFQQSGLGNVCWHEPRLSPHADPDLGSGFWTTFLEHSPITLLTCGKV